MKPLEESNPLSVFVYILCAAAAVSFSVNPVMLLIAFAGAVLLLSLLTKKDSAGLYVLFLLMFIVSALINPLFNHNGATVLFVMNNNPVTLEAAIYGAAAALMIITVLLWLRIFSVIMTADKLLCLFGTISPKLALLFSMTVRYVPLFIRQAKRVRSAQKGMALADDESIPGRLRTQARVFSVMVTWGLENGIITADSMAARGYATGRRSFYSPFRFTRSDAVLLAVTLLLSGAVLTAQAFGLNEFVFYPRFAPPACSPLGTLAYILYAVLIFLPSVIRIKENIKWKYLQSKI